MRADETLEEIERERQRRRDERAAQYRRERDAAPEPKDRLSAEWRYWKINRFSLALHSGDAGQSAGAWREYRGLLDGLTSAPDFWRTDFALALLPHLLVARQEIDGAAKRKGRRKGKGARGGSGGKRAGADAAKHFHGPAHGINPELFEGRELTP